MAVSVKPETGTEPAELRLRLPRLASKRELYTGLAIAYVFCLAKDRGFGLARDVIQIALHLLAGA